MTEIVFEVELPRGKYGPKIRPLIDAVTAELLMPGAMQSIAGVYQVRLELELVASCRVCGCTQAHACEGGCSWAEPDLCSSCIGKKKPRKK